MRYFLLILTVFAFNYSIVAQTHSETFVACDNSFTAQCELQGSNKIKVTISNGLNDTNRINYTIVTDDLDVFAITFKNKFKTLGINCADTGHLLSFSRKLFINSTEVDTLRPVAGLFTVWDSVALRKDYNTKDSGKCFTGKSLTKSKIKEVMGEIVDGYIENIKVSVEFNDTVKFFSVPYPIGISSIANFKKYSSTKLFDIDSDIRLKKVSKNQYHKDIDSAAFQSDSTHYTKRELDSINAADKHKPVNEQYYILLSDAILYDYYFGVYRRDFSPQNMTISIDGGKSQLLYKEETHKIFEAHIFTDFVGLKDDKPNGLIQTVVTKRINTNTLQHLAPKFIYWLYRSYGGFQYIAPTITISKLEDHNKQLILGNLDSVRLSPGHTDTSKFSISANRFATGLDFYQHQSFSAGADVNIGYLNNHDLKYNLYFNAGIRLGVTPVRDSLTKIGELTKTGFIKDYTINTLQLSPQLILNFLPEERFNLSVSEKLIYMKPLTQNIQLLSTDKKDIDKLNPVNSSWINVLEMLMTVQVNQKTNSKLFGRVCFSSDWKNVNNNFSQIQIGYSTFILGNK